MIKEAKDLLMAILAAHPAEGLALTRIVRTGVDEKKAVTAREHPFAALVTAQGGFENVARRSAFRDPDKGVVVKRYVRGLRTLPVTVRVWTRTEEEADALVDAFLPWIPTRWTYDGIDGQVVIKRLDASDFASAMSGQYVAAVLVEFSVEVALPGDAMPQ